MFVDPLAEQTMTPYQYVNNNPVNLIDPSGMSAEWIPGKNGNEYKDRVTYKEVNGKIEFVNLQDDLKPLFEELAKTESGKNELISLIDDKDMKVSIFTNDEKKINYDHNIKKDTGVHGTFFPKTYNDDNTAVTEAEIYIYQGWRKEEFKEHGNSESSYIIQSGKAYYFKDFTQQQFSAGDIMHEIRHRYPNNLRSLAPTGTNTEFNPNFMQGKVFDEMLINKQQNNGSKKRRR